ncbi:MAG: 3-deoxy-manno-octulosonate cytidylyltransferase [Xanthomonadales bacterium]|nr:3-deoxy-manno-octulosonate cytidylyltransferase [Gammaproteobacteria bacterium]MBT8072928.1 3-deoxy-manno-octulosonate cytidylyltransferase [Gammaproteobacteria bacterium]NNK03769.1 3-deoxy-manno-octulosonate cytidylyltransferase [Xanthomonadales bacterium]
MPGAYHIVIPARYASERLPGKVLLDLAGKPLLQHVWLRACESSAQSVVIATDDERIVIAAEQFGAQVVLTATDHKSGSDRIAECAALLGWPDDHLVVNLQGDEPLMPAACLDQVATLLDQRADCEVASLYWPITAAEEVNNPNAVKVVTDAQGRALYFSRAPIPYTRDHQSVEAAIAAGLSWKRHLGLYAYRLAALRRFTAYQPTPLELAERLEQLRIMEQGGKIAMAEACEFIPAGVDTSEDLERIRLLL